ncbi:MAG: TatD family hydrolase [Chloroflexota bacterium]
MAGQSASFLAPIKHKDPFVDTHAHLTGIEAADADTMVQAAREAGVSRILAVGTTISTSEETLAVAERHNEVFAAVGIHPNEVAAGDDLKRIEALAGGTRVRAIGETGLDYYRDRTDRALQRASLLAHLEIAASHGLPIVIHNRQADEDVLELLSRFRGRVTGVLHCFSGDRAAAGRALDLEYYLSFAGNLTYPSAAPLREIAAWAPLDRILVETDTPYLSPVPRRGKPNQPANVVHTTRVLAACRNLEVERLAPAIAANATALFGW